MQKNILAISGSTRKNSTNEAILKIISRLFNKELNVYIFNRLDELPYFNPDSVLDGSVLAPSVLNFRKQIEQADGVLICTPEYVFSLPGALKNALEWTVSTTVFSDKPFAFIVASASGEKAFESLDLIMSTLIQHPIPEEQKLLIRGGKGKINENGQVQSEETLKQIKNVVTALIRAMDRSPGNER